MHTQVDETYKNSGAQDKYFKVQLNISDQSDCEESDRVLDAQSDGVGILLLKKN